MRPRLGPRTGTAFRRPGPQPCRHADQRGTPRLIQRMRPRTSLAAPRQSPQRCLLLRLLCPLQTLPGRLLAGLRDSLRDTLLQLGNLRGCLAPCLRGSHLVCLRRSLRQCRRDSLLDSLLTSPARSLQRSQLVNPLYNPLASLALNLQGCLLVNLRLSLRGNLQDNHPRNLRGSLCRARREDRPGNLQGSRLDNLRDSLQGDLLVNLRSNQRASQVVVPLDSLLVYPLGSPRRDRRRALRQDNPAGSLRGSQPGSHQGNRHFR